MMAYARRSAVGGVAEAHLLRRQLAADRRPWRIGGQRRCRMHGRHRAPGLDPQLGVEHHREALVLGEWPPPGRRDRREHGSARRGPARRRDRWPAAPTTGGSPQQLAVEVGDVLAALGRPLLVAVVGQQLAARNRASAASTPAAAVERRGGRGLEVDDVDADVAAGEQLQRVSPAVPMASAPSARRAKWTALCRRGRGVSRRRRRATGRRSPARGGAGGRAPARAA